MLRLSKQVFQKIHISNVVIITLLICIYTLPCQSFAALSQPYYDNDEDFTVYTNYVVEKAALEEDINFVERSDDDLLIIELKVGRRIIIQEAMFAYLVRGKIFIPFSETMEALEFPIEVQPGDGYASGWFLKEENHFELDAIRYQVIINGKKRILPKDRIEIHYDDIFIDADLLGEWFPMSIEARVANQSVAILSKEPLPIENKIKREKVQDMLKTHSNYEFKLPDYPLIIPKYTLLDWPVMDIRLDSKLNRSNNTSEISSSGSLLMAGDLAYHSSSIFMSIDDTKGISNIRLKLGRSDPEGNLSEKFPITKYEFGDVFTDQIPLVSSGRSGVGAMVSSFPLERANDFNRVTLRGDIPVGWDIEVYRNDELLTFQQASEDGRYEFLDLPLIGGLNIIRTKFYGPYGEVREEVKRYLVSNEITKPGETFFSVSAVAQEEKVIDVSDKSEEDNLAKGEVSTVLEIEHGIIKNLSLNSALASIVDTQGERKNYGTLGLKTTWNTVFGTMQMSKPLDNDGLAVQFGLDTSWKRWGLSLEHREFSNFISDETDSINPTIQSTNVSINGSVKPLWENMPRLTLGGTAKREKNDIGDISYDFSQRTSTFIRRISLSNQLNYQVRNSDTQSGQLDGEIFGSAFINKISVRGDVGYTLKPIRNIKEATLTSNYKLNDKLQLRAGVKKSFDQASLTLYSLGLNKKFPKFILGVSSEYSTNSNLSIGMNMSFSLGHNPQSNDWNFYPDQISQDGLISARVYLDNDQNNEYSDGDILVENIGFKKSGTQDRDHHTNSQGVALVTGVSSHKIIPIEPNETTFLDPFWVSVKEGYNVLLRPGKIAQLDFPLIPTGEVDGTVYLIGFNKNGEQRIDPVSRAKVQLLNNKNEIVKEEISAFDGFYLFSSVPLGAYKVRIQPEQLDELGIVMLKADNEALITVDELIMSGVDLNVLRRADIGRDSRLEIADMHMTLIEKESGAVTTQLQEPQEEEEEVITVTEENPTTEPEEQREQEKEEGNATINILPVESKGLPGSPEEVGPQSQASIKILQREKPNLLLHIVPQFKPEIRRALKKKVEQKRKPQSKSAAVESLIDAALCEKLTSSYQGHSVMGLTLSLLNVDIGIGCYAQQLQQVIDSAGEGSKEEGGNPEWLKHPEQIKHRE